MEENKTVNFFFRMRNTYQTYAQRLRHRMKENRMMIIVLAKALSEDDDYNRSHAYSHTYCIEKLNKIFHDDIVPDNEFMQAIERVFPKALSMKHVYVRPSRRKVNEMESKNKKVQ